MIWMQVALVQMQVGNDAALNVSKAMDWVSKAKTAGADLVVLPEMFLCPYDTTAFPKYAQKQGGEVWNSMRNMAISQEIYLICGSVPELDQGNIYNTSYVFDPQGNQIAKHRKLHLFDIDIPGGQYFQESDTLTAGDNVTVFDTPWGKLGLMICFDIRFPELALDMAKRGAKAIFVPAAFNPTTGPAHWELLFRSRAVDSQCYMAGVSSARNPEGYQAYGHSLAVSPWAEVLCQLEEEEAMELVELDMDYVENIRTQLPLTAHRTKANYG